MGDICGLSVMIADFYSLLLALGKAEDEFRPKKVSRIVRYLLTLYYHKKQYHSDDFFQYLGFLQLEEVLHRVQEVLQRI